MEHPQSFLSNLREQTRSITALIVVWFASLSPVEALDAEESKFIDHSLMIASEYPCTWPAYPFPRFQLNHQRQIGPESNFNIDSLLIDGNTGTQLDVPPHSVARPDLNREKSGPLGLAYTDKIEAWQFGGEACVIDVRDLLDKAPPGKAHWYCRSISSDSSELIANWDSGTFPFFSAVIRISTISLCLREDVSSPIRSTVKAPGIPTPIRIAWSSLPNVG